MSRIARAFAGLAILAILGLGTACRKPGPKPARRPDAQARPAGIDQLAIRFVRLGGAAGRRPEPIFSAGETVRVQMVVTGVTSRATREIKLAAGLAVIGPENLKLHNRPLETAVSRTVPKGKATDVVGVGLLLPLPAATPPGDYRATVTVKDELSGATTRRTTSFKVRGSAPRSRGFHLDQFRAAADRDLAPGIPLVTRFTVRGFVSKAADAGRFSISLDARATILPAGPDGKPSPGAKPAASRTGPVIRSKIGFRAQQIPVEWEVPLPATLAPGRYRLRLVVTDLATGKTASATHIFQLAAGGFGIYALRTRGDGRVPRKSFVRGDRVRALLRVAGQSAPTGGKSDVSIDVGLVGPDRGFYLVRKNATRIKKPVKPEGVALEIPLTIPEFAPIGTYTVKLRARDHRTNRQASRDLTFMVAGRALRILPSLRVMRLVIRRRPGGLPLPGLFLRAGQPLALEVVVGGMRLRPEQNLYHRIHLVCALRIRDDKGRLKAEKKGACRFRRRLSFAPRRLRLHARWRIPAGLLGRHQLQVEVLDKNSDRVSLLNRKIFILLPR